LTPFLTEITVAPATSNSQRPTFYAGKQSLAMSSGWRIFV